MVLDRFTRQTPCASARKGRIHHPLWGARSARQPPRSLGPFFSHPGLSHCHPQSELSLAATLQAWNALIILQPLSLKTANPISQPFMLAHICINPAPWPTDVHLFERTLSLQREHINLPTQKNTFLTTALFRKPPAHHRDALYKVDTPSSHMTTVQLQAVHPFFPSVLSSPQVLCTQKCAHQEDILSPNPSADNTNTQSCTFSIPTAIPYSLRSPWEFSTTWRIAHN